MSSELRVLANLIAQPFEIQVRKLGRKKKRLAKEIAEGDERNKSLLNQTAERARVRQGDKEKSQGTKAEDSILEADMWG